MNSSSVNDSSSEEEQELQETGLGGTTGGGVLAGGTPTDILEGRSVIQPDESLTQGEDATPEWIAESGGGAARATDRNAPVPIDHNPATSAGTTDAGLVTGGGTESHTGGLISGGLPGEDDEAASDSS